MSGWRRVIGAIRLSQAALSSRGAAISLPAAALVVERA